MTKNIDTEQEQREQALRNRINENAKEAAGKLQEQFNKAFTEATENAKKEKERKLGCEAVRCFFSALGLGGLYLAETFGLISPILASPISAIALIYFGWHLGKFDSLRGRK